MIDTSGHTIILYRDVVLSLEVIMHKHNREGTSKCVLYREVVLSSEVIMHYSIIEKVTSKCVLYREVFFYPFIQSVFYQRFYCITIQEEEISTYLLVAV